MSDLPKSDVARLNMLVGEMLCWPDRYDQLAEPTSRLQFLAAMGLSNRGIETMKELEGSAFATVFDLAAAIDAGLNRA